MWVFLSRPKNRELNPTGTRVLAYWFPSTVPLLCFFHQLQIKNFALPLLDLNSSRLQLPMEHRKGRIEFFCVCPSKFTYFVLQNSPIKPASKSRICPPAWGPSAQKEPQGLPTCALHGHQGALLHREARRALLLRGEVGHLAGEGWWIGEVVLSLIDGDGWFLLEFLVKPFFGDVLPFLEWGWLAVVLKMSFQMPFQVVLQRVEGDGWSLFGFRGVFSLVGSRRQFFFETLTVKYRR